MKKTAVIVIGVGVIALCGVGVAFVIFWIRSQSHDLAEYLPPRPAAADASITATDAKVFDHFAVRYFQFTARKTTEANEAARLFEPQLTSAGWERIAVTGGASVSSSAWHHKEKLRGDLYLAFTVLQLDAQGDYFGTMVTMPYWTHASPDQIR